MAWFPALTTTGPGPWYRLTSQPGSIAAPGFMVGLSSGGTATWTLEGTMNEPGDGAYPGNGVPPAGNTSWIPVALQGATSISGVLDGEFNGSCTYVRLNPSALTGSLYLGIKSGLPGS